MGAADKLSDPGHQQVRRRHRFSVRVLLHIIGLYLLRIIGEEYGLFVNLFREETLVLALKILAPENIFIVKLVCVLLEDFDSLRVRQADKFVFGNVFQPRQKLFIHKLVEESKLVRARFSDVADHRFHHRFGAVHIPFQIAERHFRLDHPKLGRVAGGIGPFAPERGAEGIDVGKGHGKRFAVELSGAGHARLFAEKVLFIVRAAQIFSFRQPVEIEGGDLKHTARALAVAARDDGRMDIDKAALVEEFMNGKRRLAADLEHRVKQVGAGAEIRDFSQEFHGMTLFLQGIIGRGLALHGHGFRLDFARLLVFGRSDDLSRHDEGRAHVFVSDFVVVVQRRALEYDLHIFETASVVKLDKSERLGIADGFRPARHRHRLSVVFGKARINFFQLNSVHLVSCLDFILFNYTIFLSKTQMFEDIFFVALSFFLFFRPFFAAALKNTRVPPLYRRRAPCFFFA